MRIRHVVKTFTADVRGEILVKLSSNNPIAILNSDSGFNAMNTYYAKNNVGLTLLSYNVEIASHQYDLRAILVNNLVSNSVYTFDLIEFLD